MKNIILLIVLLFSSKEYSQCWQNISTGDNYVLAVKSDGTLWAWGSNNYSKCGPSFQNYTNTPTQVGTENNWKKSSAGFYHSMVTKTNDKLYGWGLNWEGEIGVGTSGLDYNIINYYAQVGNYTWSAVAAGNNFTIAIKTDGTLWNWGDNNPTITGDGTTVPTQIGIDNNWNKIAVGYYKSFGIKSDGTLWTWRPSSPTQIGNSNNWQVITRNYAIKSDGTLWDISSTPIQVGNDSDWVSVSKNFQGNHQLALKSDGTLWAWGENGFGELGDGTNINRAFPTQIGSNSNWSFISAGQRYSVALNSNGELWTWGLNVYGQLGDGSFDNKNTPTLINCPNTLGINGVESNNSFKIYPNPSRKIINIDINQIKSINRIYILNITGQHITEIEKNTTEINIEKLEIGIYFISIETENGNYIAKFIKR